MLLRPPAIAATLALLLAVALAGPASGARTSDPRLWATVNVCDTEAHPDTIGVRGSMPGTGRRADRMYMRFAIQYQASDGTWKGLAAGGDSGWESVGRGTWETRQSGYSFQVRPPQGSVRLRGLVRFEWRRGEKVVRREVRATSAGRESTAGADPRGWSRAVCVVKQ